MISFGTPRPFSNATPISTCSLITLRSGSSAFGAVRATVGSTGAGAGAEAGAEPRIGAGTGTAATKGGELVKNPFTGQMVPAKPKPAKQVPTPASTPT